MNQQLTQKIAFTLSEVLITLGVIGVVAAMTLPSLIHKYQMKTFEVAFKKEYSTIQNAIDYISSTENLTQCYMYYKESYNIIDSDCEQFYDELKKNLKLQESGKNLRSSYAKADDVLSNGGKSVNGGVSYDWFLKMTNSYFLKDGSIIYLSDLSFKAYNESAIILDINGQKGPNKWGYDVFWMNLTKHESGKILLTDQYASLKEKGGRYPREILRGEMNSSDNKWEW